MPQFTVEQAMQRAVQHHQAGRLPQAEQLYRQILLQAPEHAPAMHLLGLIAHQVGRSEIAVDLIGGAIALMPNDAEAHSNFGIALKANGQLDQAVAAFRRAIALRPGYAEAHYNLGNALIGTGKLDEAIVAYRQAIALNANYAEAHSNLGIALRDRGRPDEAIAAYRRAIALKPDYADAYSNLGIALRDTGRPDEAIAAWSSAIALNPNLAQAHRNLGNALANKGQFEEALVAYGKAIALNPSSAELHSNTVYMVCFHPDYDPQRILDEARAWARRHADPLAAQIRPHLNDRSPDRPLRIGYVSPNFRDHVVGRNILPMLEHHDHRQFQVHCFSSVNAPDAMTDRFRRIADHWHDTAGMNDADLADLVRREQIDILVDLNLHMEGGRLLAFAHKPAPVQVTWAGYPGTTGLSTIDYRLTDPYLDPPGTDDEFYSEKSVRLPHSFWCFRPMAQTPDVSPLPALSNGFVTFGCLNNFCKVTEPALHLWAHVLQTVNDSRLLILSPRGAHRDRVLRQFQAAGVHADRVEFAQQLPLLDYLRLHHRIDIALDPIPYTGHSTSLDAFWMGVPVVTLAGRTVASRGGVSIATNLGITELIANTSDEYVAVAARLARDLRGLAELRSTMRERMQRSPLMDERQFAADLENVYRVMWKQWCHEAPSRT